jgi:hypothetical protein
VQVNEDLRRAETAQAAQAARAENKEEVAAMRFAAAEDKARAVRRALEEAAADKAAELERVGQAAADEARAQDRMNRLALRADKAEERWRPTDPSAISPDGSPVRRRSLARRSSADGGGMGGVAEAAGAVVAAQKLASPLKRRSLSGGSNTPGLKDSLKEGLRGAAEPTKGYPRTDEGSSSRGGHVPTPPREGRPAAAAASLDVRVGGNSAASGAYGSTPPKRDAPPASMPGGIDLGEYLDANAARAAGLEGVREATAEGDHLGEATRENADRLMELCRQETADALPALPAEGQPVTATPP